VRIGYDAKRLFNNFTGLGNYSRFIVGGVQKFFPEEQLVLFTPKLKEHPETKEFTKAASFTTVLPSSFLTTFKLGSYWRSFLLKEEAKRAKLDIFHGLSHELPRGISSVAKSIVTVHDLIFLRYPQFYKALDRWIYTKKLTYACREADCIIAISEQTKNDLIEFLKVPDEKIVVVYQGCHPNFYRSISKEELSAVRQKYKLPDQFLLNVGTIESRKNALLLIKALKEITNNPIPLVIVGRATTYLEEIKSFMAANNLEKRVHFIHKASFADLPALYHLSTVFLYPSLFEGFGIPLVEAIACGVPVITSTGSCFSEAAGPAALYVDPQDAKGMTAAIERVLQDTSLRKNMVEQSTAYIKRFESEVIAKEMMKVYRSLVK
jgi:glycosyltransferase involved in cell wall biosynthesis